MSHAKVGQHRDADLRSSAIPPLTTSGLLGPTTR
jgi:hypothetical protein